MEQQTKSTNQTTWRKSFVNRFVPKGLYARATLILLMPLLLLQSVLLFVFMERHWELVTKRLSAATARDIAAVIAIYQTYPQDDDHTQLIEIARDRLQLQVQLLPDFTLPEAGPKPFFSILDRTLTNEIRERIDYPFWIQTVGMSNHVEIRVLLKSGVMRILARRGHTYASNSHIFLVWMIGTSLVLFAIAMAFLRNQIKPILKLVEAADRFGRGLPAPVDFKPRGAREVRRAALSFMEMRDRIENHVEQRTTILAGVSHDLRTILTRMKLQTALLPESEEVNSLTKDVNEMQQMLEDYMAFAKGIGEEATNEVDLNSFAKTLQNDVSFQDKIIQIFAPETPILLPLKKGSMNRAIYNLMTNAARYGDNIDITISKGRKWASFIIDDDGPGISEDQREAMFQPFRRLDEARNQDAGHTGLGLSITRDIVTSHGGKVVLEDSPLGGLRAHIKLPI